MNKNVVSIVLFCFVLIALIAIKAHSQFGVKTRNVTTNSQKQNIKMKIINKNKCASSWNKEKKERQRELKHD